MNYRISPYCLVLCLCALTNHVVADVSITLYQPEQQQTITLIAEVGFGDQAIYPLSQELQTTIQNSDSVLIETETGTSQTRSALQHAILTGRTNQLQSAIKAPTWDQLQHWITQKQGQPGVHLINALSPHWALALITNTNLKNKAGLSITQYLISQTTRPTAILTAQEQLEWYLRFSADAIDSLIKQSVHESSELYDTITKAWHENNQGVLQEVIDTITLGDSGQQIQQNYDALNAILISRLKLLPPGNHVAAINIVSYLGDNNVVDRLLANGYQIKDQ